MYINNINVEQKTTTGNLTYLTNSPLLSNTTASLNGSLTLTNTSNFVHVITGTASGYSVVLPQATTLTNGWKFEIWNENTLPISLKYNDTTTFLPIPSKSFVIVTLEDNTTTNGLWLSYRAFTGTASGILNYYITASTSFTTASTTDVLVTGMSVLPVEGTYAVWYNASLACTGNNMDVYCTIYKNGDADLNTRRRIRTSVSTAYLIQSTNGIVFFDGAQTCSLQVRRSGGTQFTISERSLILIRLGD